LTKPIYARGLSAGHVLYRKSNWPKQGYIGLIIDESNPGHPTGHRVLILWQDKATSGHYVSRLSLKVIKENESGEDC